jgi:GGDEF domain-containing protein
MAPDAPHRRPGRPVADAPIERLLAHTEDVARSWMFALLCEVELHESPGVVTEPFTRDGPRICDAALRALVEDSDLRRLERDGALWPLAARVGEMTGSSAPQRVLAAVDALYDVLWRELRGELRGAADPDLVADLATRLSRVCALIRDAGLAGAGAGPGREPGQRRGLGERGTQRREGARAPWEDDPGPKAEERAADARPGGDAGPGEAAGAGDAGEAGDGRELEPGREPGDTGETRRGPAAGAQTLSTAGTEGPPPGARPVPLWVGALTEEIEAAKASFAPLSLLLAELEDADRIVASAGAERADRAFSEFALALRRALRRQDILVQETPFRAWVIARDTARAGAHSLGTRIAESVGETSSLSGSPLVSSVGVAVLGEDGIDCAQLMEAAEEARFAASARGIEVSRRMR